MGRFDSRESQDRMAIEQIAAFRSVAGLLPALRKVLGTFDGKVLNCRLEKALHEATGVYFHAQKRHTWLEIETSHRGRTYVLAKVDVSAMAEGRRIPAEMLIESAKGYREKYLHEAARLEREMQMVDEYESQIEYIKAMLDRVQNGMSYYTREIYGLHARLAY